MKRAALAAALVLAIGSGTMAIAQTVGGDGPPEDPGAFAEGASSFGECVSEASEAGAENPAELCAELKPGGNGGAGEETARGGPAEGTHAAACKDEPKRSGAFGRCISERASAFGRCVSEHAEAGVRNPTAACDELKPEGDRPNRSPEGAPGGDPEGTANGRPEGVPNGKPEGTPDGGRPEGVPNGKPEGTPDGGKPDGVPNGKPEGTPGGEAQGTPGGKPEGTPEGGKPEGTPDGKPAGTPGPPGS